MEKEKTDISLLDIFYAIVFVGLFYIIFFSDYSLFKDVKYSQVDIITKDDIKKDK